MKVEGRLQVSGLMEMDVSRTGNPSGIEVGFYYGWYPSVSSGTPIFYDGKTIGELGFGRTSTEKYSNALFTIDFNFRFFVEPIERKYDPIVKSSQRVPIPSVGWSAELYFYDVDIWGTVYFYKAKDPSQVVSTMDFQRQYRGNKIRLREWYIRPVKKTGTYTYSINGLFFPNTLSTDLSFLNLSFMDFSNVAVWMLDRSYERGTTFYFTLINSDGSVDLGRGRISNARNVLSVVDSLDQLEPKSFTADFYYEGNLVTGKNWLWWVKDFNPVYVDTYYSRDYDGRLAYTTLILNFDLLTPKQVAFVRNDFGIRATITHDMTVHGDGKDFYILYFTYPTGYYSTNAWGPRQPPPKDFPLMNHDVAVTMNQKVVLCLSHARRD